MMRGRRHMAVAVRTPEGEVVVHEEPLTSAIYTSDWARWPLVRGAIALWDSLVLGTPYADVLRQRGRGRGGRGLEANSKTVWGTVSVLPGAGYGSSSSCPGAPGRPR